ncbi:MAG: hypothetical protein NVV82_19225 [Sporocytophaga sp.]|nr:hypothetical protein [Sporocytophaga sp.]
MSAFMERTVDAEMLASFQEEDEFLRNTMTDYSEYNNRGRNASPRDKEKKSFDASYWTEKLNRTRPKETVTEDYKNPFSGFGNTFTKQPETKPEPGIFGKVANWISDNPGTAILAALLVGGGAYLLAKHFNGSNSENKESNSSNSKSRKRRVKKAALEQDNDISKEENSEYDLSPKEFAIGAATAAGGALLGTVLEDYSIAASIPVAALGLTKKNIPIIAAALGLALSKPLRSILRHFFGNDLETKEKMKEKGYVETMFGFMKPAQGASEDS